MLFNRKMRVLITVDDDAMSRLQELKSLIFPQNAFCYFPIYITTVAAIPFPRISLLSGKFSIKISAIPTFLFIFLTDCWQAWRVKQYLAITAQAVSCIVEEKALRYLRHTMRPFAEQLRTIQQTIYSMGEKISFRWKSPRQNCCNNRRVVLISNERFNRLLTVSNGFILGVSVFYRVLFRFKASRNSWMCRSAPALFASS